MEFVQRADIKRNKLPGRVVQNAVGRESAVASEKMTVSFCRYSEESGPMAPHNHAEETVVVLDGRGGVRPLGLRAGFPGAHGDAAPGGRDALPGAGVARVRL